MSSLTACLGLTLTYIEHSHSCTHYIPLTHLAVFTLTLMHLDIITHTETLAFAHLNTVTLTHVGVFTHPNMIIPTHLNITTITRVLHSHTWAHLHLCIICTLEHYHVPVLVYCRLTHSHTWTFYTTPEHDHPGPLPCSHINVTPTFGLHAHTHRRTHVNTPQVLLALNCKDVRGTVSSTDMMGGLKARHMEAEEAE